MAEARELKYRRIAEDLRAGIRAGEYTPGGALPGENDLMARYQVARMTVRQALAELQREGLAVARRGSGVYVSAAAAGAGRHDSPITAAAHDSTGSTDPSCAVAHGSGGGDVAAQRTLVVVYGGEIARLLVAFATECNYAVVVVEPDQDLAAALEWAPKIVRSIGEAGAGPDTDIVVTDHHRLDLGVVLRDALAGRSRWIGLMGNPRHVGPHHGLLAELGVNAEQIARVRRPIGLNIGSRTPAEIAISTLAGLLADRAGRPGGFAF
ncbi:MAG: XdhC family protein [Sporichthyaceae bacterium]